MTQTASTTAARLRSELGHPVIDRAGHLVEVMAAFVGFVRDHAT